MTATTSFELTVLGTATPYPQPDRACSGYLLTTGDTTVWVDAGAGSLANLQRHTALELLDAIWISHLHADHEADLISAYYALAFGGLAVAAPIPVYAPAGLAQRLAGFFARSDTAFLEQVLCLHELHEGHRVVIGPLTLTARAVHHDVEAYALRAEAYGRTLVFSGDTGQCAALDDLAAGAHLLLCESESDTWPQGQPQWHHTPEDAGRLARRTDPEHLVITHVGPTLTPDAASARAAEVFGGPTSTAREGDVYRV